MSDLGLNCGLEFGCFLSESVCFGRIVCVFPLELGNIPLEFVDFLFMFLPELANFFLVASAQVLGERN